MEDKDAKPMQAYAKTELFVDAVINEQIMEKFWKIVYKVRKPKNLSKLNEQQLI